MAWEISSRGLSRAPLRELELLLGSASVLEGDASGDTVFRSTDGRVVKLFYQRRLFSSTLLKSYSRRFADNARALARLQIPCVEIERIFAVPEAQRHVVVYRWLEGQPLRHALGQANAPIDELVAKLAAFLALLHDRGVFFRSLHFANVIVLPSGELGLIDVEDLSMLRAPLSLARRVRNFRHLWRYAEDVAALDHFGLELFVDTYLGASEMAASKHSTARRRILDLLMGLAKPQKRDKSSSRG